MSRLAAAAAAASPERLALLQAPCRASAECTHSPDIPDCCNDISCFAVLFVYLLGEIQLALKVILAAMDYNAQNSAIAAGVDLWHHASHQKLGSATGQGTCFHCC